MWLYEGSKNIWSHTTWVSQARIFGPTWVYQVGIFGATPHGFLKQEYLEPHWFITIGGNAWLICKNQCGGFPPHLNIHRHSHHFHSHQQYQHFQLHHHHHPASWQIYAGRCMEGSSNSGALSPWLWHHIRHLRSPHSKNTNVQVQFQNTPRSTNRKDKSKARLEKREYTKEYKKT